MIVIPFLVVVMIAFVVLLVRSVRAGYGKLLLALVVPVLAVYPLVAYEPQHTAAEVVVVNTLVIAALVAPVWLVVSWVKQRRRGVLGLRRPSAGAHLNPGEPASSGGAASSIPPHGFTTGPGGQYCIHCGKRFGEHP